MQKWQHIDAFVGSSEYYDRYMAALAKHQQ
jgi:hypothetical protein